ncbi:GPR1/FUN34/yaaH family-domain-containing protein [Hyaloraphidium curvatum]|nr:GPR1/FUN34/yaaH family-domain-containing protein [Hyaloraphidium curvatum]
MPDGTPNLPMLPGAIPAEGGFPDEPPKQSPEPARGDNSAATTSFRASVLDEGSKRMTPSAAALAAERHAFLRHSSFRAAPDSAPAGPFGDPELVFRTDSSGAIANPAPLGLFSFALTTLFLSFKNAGAVEGQFADVVFAYAIALGGIVQILAGQWEFVKKNTFGAVAFNAYGAFWIGIALFHYSGLAWPSTEPKATKGMTAFFAIWAVFTLAMWTLTFRISVALCVTFGLLFITFVLLAGGLYSAACEQAAGYLGIFTGLAAGYAAFAALANEMEGREVVPVGPFAEIWKRRREAAGKAV